MSTQLSISCKLCFKAFTTYQKLLVHERNKHLHNKTIPHFYSLSQPSSEQMFCYISSFIVLIKKNWVFLDMLLEKNVFQSKPFQRIFLYIYLKMKKILNTVPPNTNINVILGDLLERLDLSKYSNMISGVSGKIL
jgi:hypothetical protein